MTAGVRFPGAVQTIGVCVAAAYVFTLPGLGKVL